jgi:hypothetical protein
MDFRYDAKPEDYSPETNPNFQIWESDSPTFNLQFHTVATDEWGIGSMLGDLWITYADWAADTNGKVRITPKTKATLSDESFLYATMEVDMVSTDRRYPQLFISDREAPIQNDLENGVSVLVQTRGGITGPVDAQIQFCDHRTWDVNNQCPMWDLYKLNDGTQDFLAPHPEVNSLAGVDRTVLFEVFVSTGRVYLYTDGMPYGCVNLPAGRLPAGPATVTFGDVLYHSGVDLADWYPFHLDKMHTITSRHYSNMAFASNRPGPNWDESKMPCVHASGLK